MANSIIKTENQLQINNDVNNVVFIKYQWYTKDAEFLVASKNSSYTYILPKDGVFEVYQAEVAGEYSLDNNLLKKGDEVIHNFNGTVFDAAKINLFLKDTTPNKYVSTNKLQLDFSDIVICLMNLKISGVCKLPKELVEKRDLLIMSLMAISIFEENNSFFEIQRIIESFTSTECSITNLNCGC